MLQSCANVKSAEARLDDRHHKRRGLGHSNNILIFNILRRGNFHLVCQGRSNPQANLNEGVTVSTTFSTEDGASGMARMGPLRRPQVSRNTGFPRFYSRVSTLKTGSRRSDNSRAAKEPDRQHEERADETQDAVNGDPHNAERKRQQPNDGIKRESEQGNWPAQDEQDDPQ